MLEDVEQEEPKQKATNEQPTPQIRANLEPVSEGVSWTHLTPSWGLQPVGHIYLCFVSVCGQLQTEDAEAQVVPLSSLRDSKEAGEERSLFLCSPLSAENDPVFTRGC